MSQGDPPEHDPYAPPRAPIGPAGPIILLGDDDGDRPRSEPIGGSPWATIWARPRSTIRTIVATRPRYVVLLLACLYGVDCASTALGQLNNIPALRELPATTLIAWAAIGGSVFGDVGFSLFGWLVGLSGRLLGGQGTSRGTRAALAWGSVPNLVPMAQLMASFLISGRGFLSPASDAKPDLLLLAYLASSLVFGIWTAVVTLKCVGEVHRFSSWKAFASLLLASLAGIALFVLAGVLVGVLFAALKAA